MDCNDNSIDARSQVVEVISKLYSQTVMFADIVESTSHVNEDGDLIYEVWRSFLRDIEKDILPESRGRLVRSLGDGFLAIFESSIDAVEAAIQISRLIKSARYSVRLQNPLVLRIGLEQGDFTVDRFDVYGRSAMIAARLVELAGPDEIYVSANVIDHISPGVTVDIEDMGPRYLKHLPEPLRVFRVGPKGEYQENRILNAEDLRPTIAIVPLSGVRVEDEDRVLGEVIADKLITHLSVGVNANVISRLSSSRLSRHNMSPQKVSNILQADLIVTGSYWVTGSELSVSISMIEASTDKILWSGESQCDVHAIFSHESELVLDIAKNLCSAMMMRTIEHAFSYSLSTVDHYILYMGAINLMHRLSPTEFNRARDLLIELTRRATRISEPYAWLANWHVLRVQQGWSDDPQADGNAALGFCQQALDNNPMSSIAMAINGFVHTNLLRRLDVSEKSYNKAIEFNPNNSLAWILRGTLRAFQGEGVQAVHDAEKALSLSPIDPHRYFYVSLASTAYLANKDYANALHYADMSYRLNRTHTSTLRVKAASLWHLGRQEEARQTGRELLALEPELTISEWLKRSPSSDYPIGKDWAEVLTHIGVPK